MSKSRRQFLTRVPLALLGAAVVSYSQTQKPPEPPPGAPPAFGTAPPVGPEVSPATFAQAEKLVEVELSAEELALAAGNWRSAMAPLYESRVGPRKVTLEATLAPASRWNPVLPGEKSGPASNESSAQSGSPGSTSRAWNSSTPSCVALSRSPANWRSHKPRKLIRRSRLASIAVPCTESRGARRTFWTQRAFPPLMAPSHFGIAFPPPTRWSSSVLMMRARCWLPS